jgi:hypothetical protein
MKAFISVEKTAKDLVAVPKDFWVSTKSGGHVVANFDKAKLERLTASKIN